MGWAKAFGLREDTGISINRHRLIMGYLRCLVRDGVMMILPDSHMPPPINEENGCAAENLSLMPNAGKSNFKA